MPTKPKKQPNKAPRAARDDDDDDEDLVPLPAEPEPDDASAADLAAVLAELGGASDASISVNKVTLQGEERLGKFMPREFDVDSLRDRYGGGVYWLYFHVGGKLHTKRRVIFAKSLEELRGAEPGAARSHSASGIDAFAQALDRMAQQQRELFNQVLTIVTSQRSQGPGVMEMIDAASKLANLNNRNASGSELDAVLRGVKLARELGGEGAGGSMLGEAAAEFVRVLREQPPRPALPAPGATGEGDQMQSLIRTALTRQLPVLIRGAQGESDVGVYAQLLFDQVPEIYIAPLIAYLQKPDWFDMLVKADGRVVPLQAWFEALRNEIIRANSQEDSPPG